MALPLKALKGKALGFVVAIEKLSSTERAQTPSGNFGEDYNRLRELVAELLPDIAPLLPPEATIASSAYTDRPFSDLSYAELLTFSQQLYQFLDSAGDD